ncbi:3995_t:CDS:1 [Scutellospora calospora]|uniref:3995_t:CDS:1 n=1 Tax=Scutellospora calospora TaxID=85575 RepID=A0ACA9MFB8_9GLOM|nr:3995_t:CDS:1 [Scutellospora calospora]
MSMSIPIMILNPRDLSIMFKDNEIFKHIDKKKVFDKLVVNTLRVHNLQPDDIKEIILDTWERRGAEFDKFLEDYTKEVNSHRQKRLPLNIKMCTGKPKPKKKVIKVDDTTTTDYASGLFQGFQHPSKSRATSNQSFDMNGGNNTVFDDGNDDFRQYIDYDQCLN